MAKAGFRTVKISMAKTELILYGGRKLVSAIADIAEKASIYEGVKLAQIMEAVYLQGKKDGAREAFESIDRSMVQVKKAIPHNRPGRPKRK